MTSIIRRHAGALQLVLVIAIVGSAVLLSASLKPDEREARPRAATDRVPVTVVEPAPTTFTPRVELNGVVEARTVTSIIPQVDGRVIEVSPYFRAGAAVRQGDILFRIDPSDYELAIERTLADIEFAKSELAQLEAEAAAEREVWQLSSPEREIPPLRARIPQIAAAKARLQGGEAARAAAELALSRTVVRAPFDARILDTRLDLGQVVGTTRSVGDMFATESLEIAVPVSGDELKRIGSIDNRSARITTASGDVVEGTVVRKAAALDERTRLGTLFIAGNDPSLLTLGEFVSVEINGAVEEAALRLPAAALTSRDQLWVVEGSELMARQIELLGQDGNELIVRSFDMADGVVAVPPSDARVGMPVERSQSPQWAAAGGVVGAAAK